MIAGPALVTLGGALIAGAIDARTGYIPDRISRTTTALAIALAAAHHAVLGACAGALLLGGAFFALHVLTGGRGLGLGDMKLAAAIGAGFGLAGGTLALGAAFVAGGAYGAWLLARGAARRGDALRFGPFLAFGTAAAALASAVQR